MANKDFKVKNGLDIQTPLPVSMGGTGQTSTTNTLNALLPSQAGNTNKVLASDGTNTTWVAQAIAYQRGGTASRPVSPTVGDLYYNTDYNYFESYTTNGWFPIAAAPGIPTGVTATDQPSGRAFNNGQMSVAFTPNSNGGAASSFIVTPSPTTSPSTFTGGSSPISVTGLASSTQYTYTVQATSPYGTSSASSASSGVTATTVPQAPTIGTATAGDAQASVTFTANATGGSAITSYIVTSSPGNITASGASSPLTVTGLTNGTAYTFTVTATNANGTSAASAASSSVTPNPDPSFITLASGMYGIRAAAINTNNNNTQYFVTAPTNNTYAVSLVLDNNGDVSANPSLSNFYTGNTGSGGIGFDSSNNWYVGQGFAESSGNNNKNASIAKYNSSNVLQWYTRLNYGNTEEFYHIAVSSAGNCYATGYMYNTETFSYNGIIAKCNSSGTGQWSYRTTNPSFLRKLTLDSSENVFVVTNANTGARFTKINSSGTHQWSQLFSSASSAAYDIKVDSSGNIYVFGGVGSSAWLSKHDSTGALTWQRTLTGTSSISASALCLDSSGNIYVTGYTTDNSVGKAVIAKYNNSGTIQWQRYLSTSADTNIYSYDISINSTGTFVVIAGQYSTTGFVAKLPTDGSKTGTYSLSGTWTYAAANLTDAAGSMTMSSSSVSLTSGNGLSTTTNPSTGNYGYSFSKVTL